MHRIGYLLCDGFQVMAIATQTVFEFANEAAGNAFYTLENYSIAGGEVRSSLGMSVRTLPAPPRRQMDTWMVAGVIDPVAMPASEEALAYLRRASARARRVAGICTGGFVLAEAGLLDGRRATTHWAIAREMQARHPAVRVEEDRIYIVDGTVWTSAGMTAGLDLALAMVEKDLGADVARSVAHKLVMHQRRSGGQSQHSEMLDLAPKSDRIQNALDYARRNLGSPLTVETLAEAVHLSPRQFSRVFTAETGQSPARAIEGLRLEAARLMIEQSAHPLDTIARETGFRDRRHMREAFMRGFGVPPQAVRREARAAG
ncbi:GlxA family transcriptional regulator [Paraburkholderia tropica]|uniref:GlxA family transcriptional regulator n=1 Tax=Paraburkholderia tropica TaxID=92647 RepID=UPI0007ED4E7F|nr:GlxA family transcriptional regulator [Paraburkholderia tropica]MBB2980718.1 transcriptional regulator GlxA family with amidase domain [Paraburkholderia tropica]MBB3003390.1 transcriptional regulator GlxA family with amidase domain [Paraburkholderia tropica]MBB6322406.1 transcriptional regulator GlxA family with amidase domain [Paraburkholderia tropica]OBR48191.1 AraC family transcriptional regulator [Paraburkholderia tropica]QNB16758.1 GlxA family transcriptional regulator [Paraburkholderi